MLSCKTRGKKCAGKTVKMFRSRWNNYQTDAESGNMGSCKQQFLQNQFLQDNFHEFLVDVEVILIDKTQVSDPTKRECYWMKILKICILMD